MSCGGRRGRRRKSVKGRGGGRCRCPGDRGDDRGGGDERGGGQDGERVGGGGGQDGESVGGTGTGGNKARTCPKVNKGESKRVMGKKKGRKGHR